MMNDTIPLLMLALELGAEPAELARRLDGEVSTDPASGLRVVPAAVCRRLIDERQARQAAQIEARRQAANVPNPVQQRVRAIQARQAQLRTDGLLEAGASPFVAVKVGDPDPELESAGHRLDDYLTAGRRGDYGVMYTFHPQKG
jgi:hypothetical protein